MLINLVGPNLDAVRRMREEKRKFCRRISMDDFKSYYYYPRACPRGVKGSRGGCGAHRNSTQNDLVFGLIGLMACENAISKSRKRHPPVSLSPPPPPPTRRWECLPRVLFQTALYTPRKIFKRQPTRFLIIPPW